MAEIRAAGVVLHRKEPGGWLYLILRNAKHGGIGTPKGHLEPGEPERAGAARETLEETGIAVEPGAWFERRVRYPVKKGLKQVVYFVAETDEEEFTLSKEHDAGAWTGIVEALAEIRHENLRGVLRDAAVFLKDPALRGGLSPDAARALCEARLEPAIVAHVAQVADMARALADGVDENYVEACAWLHDIGRAVDHARHPLAGFELLVAEGHAGYAPPCISHYSKGRPHADCGPLADALWRACDLSTFPAEEQVVALADFLAAGDERVTLERRHADLCKRYGRSAFIDQSLAISRELKAAWEARTGRDLYATLGI